MGNGASDLFHQVGDNRTLQPLVASGSSMSVPENQLEPLPSDIILDADGNHDLYECRCWDCRDFWASVLADERYDVRHGN